jgi:hypothetical protein
MTDGEAATLALQKVIECTARVGNLDHRVNEMAERFNGIIRTRDARISELETMLASLAGVIEVLIDRGAQ